MPEPSYLSGFSETVAFLPDVVPGIAVRPPLSPLDGRVPHLVWPLTVRDGRLATVEQDTLADVRGCVNVLLRTPLGARPLAPAIGFEDPTFTAGVAPGVLAGEIERQEDRAAVRVETAGVAGDGSQRVRIHVELAGLQGGEGEAL